MHAKAKPLYTSRHFAGTCRLASIGNTEPTEVMNERPISQKVVHRRRRYFGLGDIPTVLVWIAGKLYFLLPRRFLFRLAALQGILLSIIRTRDRTKIDSALVESLKTSGHSEISGLRRRNFQYLEKLHLTYRVNFTSEELRNSWASIEGIENLETALASGKGAILLTTHFGYGRMVKPILESRGRRVLVIGRAEKASDKELTRFGLTMSRLLKTSNFQGRDIESGMNLRPLLAALARNEIVLTAGDGGWSSTVVYANLVNQIFSFYSGIFSVARSSGATLIPVFVVDNDPAEARFKLIIHEPLTLSPASEDDLANDVDRFASLFGSYILRYPHLLDWRKRSRSTKRQLAAKSRSGSLRRRKRVGLEDAIHELKSGNHDAPGSSGGSAGSSDR